MLCRMSFALNPPVRIHKSDPAAAGASLLPSAQFHAADRAQRCSCRPERSSDGLPTSSRKHADTQCALTGFSRRRTSYPYPSHLPPGHGIQLDPLRSALACVSATGAVAAGAGHSIALTPASPLLIPAALVSCVAVVSPSCLSRQDHSVQY